MWQIKRFKSYASQMAWIKKNDGRIQWVQLFINNGYAIEYRKLRVIY